MRTVPKIATVTAATLAVAVMTSCSSEHQYTKVDGSPVDPAVNTYLNGMDDYHGKHFTTEEAVMALVPAGLMCTSPEFAEMALADRPKAEADHFRELVTPELCASVEDENPTPTPVAPTPPPAPAPSILEFGETYEGDRSNVTVDMEVSGGTVAVTQTVENTGTDVMPSYNFIASATVDGAEAPKSLGTDYGPAGDILPGRTGSWTTSFDVPATSGELSFQLGYGLSDNIYWVGQLDTPAAAVETTTGNSNHCDDPSYWSQQSGDPSDYVAACGEWPSWVPEVGETVETAPEYDQYGNQVPEGGWDYTTPHRDCTYAPSGEIVCEG